MIYDFIEVPGNRQLGQARHRVAGGGSTHFSPAWPTRFDNATEKHWKS